MNYIYIYIHHKTIRSAATKYSGTSGSTLIGPMFASFAVCSVHWASLISHHIHSDEANLCCYSDGGTEQRLGPPGMKINIQQTCKSQDESLPFLVTNPPPKVVTFHWVLDHFPPQMMCPLWRVLSGQVLTGSAVRPVLMRKGEPVLLPHPAVFTPPPCQCCAGHFPVFSWLHQFSKSGYWICFLMWIHPHCTNVRT